MRLVFVICLRMSSKKKKERTPKQRFTFLTILLYHLAFPVSPVASVFLPLFLTFSLSHVLSIFWQLSPLCITSYIALFAFDSFFLLLVVFFPSSNTLFRASILPPPPPTVYFWPHQLTDTRQVFNCLPSTLNEWVYTTWIRYSYISSRAFFHPPPVFWDWEVFWKIKGNWKEL